MADSTARGVVLSSQMVEDIKPPTNPDLARSIRGLRATCNKRSIPGDKLTAGIYCSHVDAAGTLHAELRDGVLAPESEWTEAVIRHRFPLKLTGFNGPLTDPTAVFKSVPGTIVQDGGNIQNMILDLCVLVEGMSRRYPALFGPEALPITIASTADPFRSSPALARFHGRVRLHQLDQPNRYGVHLGFEDDPQSQRRYCITSDPVCTADGLAKLAVGSTEFGSAIRTARTVVSSDPLFDLAAAMCPNALYMVNASTKFRQDVALRALKTAAILPMNSAEAAQVYHQMRAKALDVELKKCDEPAFPSPIATDLSAIDPGSLRTLDTSLAQAIGCNPLSDNIYFGMPISFGTDGGFLVRAGRSARIACFTSIPSRAREVELIAKYSTEGPGKKNDVGAGDGTATAVLLGNLVDPMLFLGEKMKGREDEHRMIPDLAAAIFTGVLSRLVSTLVVFANETYLANIEPDGIADLADIIAEESVDAARRVVKTFANGPQFTSIDRFGIKVIVWPLGCAVAEGA